MRKLSKLDSQRFVGDTRTMTVHDRWHDECEDCLVEAIIASGAAVEFEPDEFSQALWEDFEPCDACFDRSDPSPPAWAAKELDNSSK